MPGGKSFRRWYAMRQRLITEGKWLQKGAASQQSPAAAKRPRLEEGESSRQGEEPDDLPALEEEPTAEGK